MKKVKILFAVMIAAALYGCKSDNDTVADTTPSEVITLNVDVVLPADVRKQCQPSIDWALANLHKAQQRQAYEVKLNLRYHDENTEDVDALGYQLTHPEAGADTCHAVIGPYYTAHANDILRYAGRNRLPVIMPTCAGSELQRTNARNTFAWFLTESDITQCEMMVTGVSKVGDVDAVLVYSDDAYGQSFRDWFGYFATARQLHIAGDGITAFKSGANVTEFLNAAAADCKSRCLAVCIALSDVNDYWTVTEQVRLWKNTINKALSVKVILSDTSLDDKVIQREGLAFDYGVSPTASPGYGFSQSYEARFGSAPMNVEARIYDALTMLAMGAAHRRANGDNCKVDGRQVAYTEKPYGPTLTDHMRSIVASKEGAGCDWETTGLARAFAEIAAGRSINVTGASGSLTFDSDTHTKVLGTDYMFWRVEVGKQGRVAKPILHISTESSNTQASTKSLWELDKMWSPDYEDVPVNHNLPDVTDRWAVVISPSTTWSNYRHQADAFAMYSTLRQHGYDDDHIVLIVEDNLANSDRNVFPGQIFVERSSDPAAASDPFVNDDVRKNAVVDYHFSDLQPGDVADIMMGRRSERLSQVISPTASSDVFFFWSGHGGSQEGPLWGNEDAVDYFGKDRIHDIVAEMAGQQGNGTRMYRRMMFAIETCFSGQWGEALTGLPDVLVLTAANAYETSKADAHNSELGVYLSNAFARTFRRRIAVQTDITIFDLYQELFRTTKGSHVSIYNQQQYGSVHAERMSEFLTN
jgi:glycosylphosphatidylinositol transamidase (GPIT) subunit GPI8/ABC-type branched-subunit amino acid transport system substrate-binding protein